MRKTFLAVLAVIVAGATLVGAADSTLSYTAGQSNNFRNRGIPRYNAEHCTKFGQPLGCTSADLVTGGCVVQSVRTIVIESCTIFTSDAAGEAAFLKEVANIGLIAIDNRLTKAENETYLAAECSRFKSLNQTQKDAECTARGLSAGCAGICP